MGQQGEEPAKEEGGGQLSGQTEGVVAAVDAVVLATQVDANRASTGTPTRFTGF
jgi:hypothetical protein